ncbi:hypothetical protein TWF696_001789 [Orbilia brochopaga]|uniref:Uncharacterized protein n=1 Tax=Orbilia brochopaga TaxID=3140254 RepID=A0AAV9U6K1_9PEZI
MGGIWNRSSSKSGSKPLSDPIPKPPKDAGTVNKNRSGAFRATNISGKIKKTDFEKLVQDQITDEERSNGVEVQRLDLTPDPVRPSKQMAIFQFHKGPPERFKPSKDNPEGKFFLKPPSSNSRTPIKIDSDFWGLTQLYVPEKQIAIDVVALTGLNAHAFGSWTGPLEGQERTMWLRDFLPDEEDVGPYCRVMTYGYNARTKDNAVHGTIDYARGLLRELNKARSGDEAYTLAFWEKKEFGSIFHSILGICSFGVPWTGINLDDVDVQLESEPEEYDHGLTLMKNISYEGKTINLNTIGFRRLLGDTNTRVITFYETLKTKSLIKNAETGQWSRSGPYIIVVSKESAVLGIGDLEEQQDADGDHSSLVKFTGQDNRAYTTILRFVDELIEDGEEEIGKRIAADREQEKRQHEIFGGIRSKLRRAREKRRNLKQGKKIEQAETEYILGQLLRIAVDAGLYQVASWLLDGPDDTDDDDPYKARKKGTVVPADPDFQAHAADYEKYHEQFSWYLDADTKSRILASSSLSEKERNEVYLGEMLGGDATPLSLAINRRNILMVKLLLEHGADPGKPCSAFSNDSTPVHQACRIGAYDILEVLLAAPGGTPNVKTSTCHTTPLHDAASISQKLCEILLKKGANVNAKLKPSGMTALHIAAGRGDHNLVVKLREYGADISALDCEGSTALHDAANGGHLGVVKVLLSHSRDRHLTMNLQNADGNTALHLAARKGYANVVKELADQMGAKPDIQNRLKETALSLAIERGHHEVRRILQTLGVEASGSPQAAESSSPESLRPPENMQVSPYEEVEEGSEDDIES